MARSAPREPDLTDAQAAVLGNTRRARRKLPLTEIATRLRLMCDAVGGVEKVAPLVDLSAEMVRQFLRVEKLVPAVRRLVEQGRIQSVDIADRISRLPARDQIPVAQAVVQGRLRSEDVRAIVSLRRDAPDLPIADVMRRVEASRPIKEYLVEFRVPHGRPGQKVLRARFARIVGAANIRSLQLNGNIGILALTAHGNEALARAARSRGGTRRELVDSLVAGEVA